MYHYEIEGMIESLETFIEAKIRAVIVAAAGQTSPAIDNAVASARARLDSALVQLTRAEE